MLPLQVLPTRVIAMEKAADRLEEALRNGFATRGAACAALSGGSTPEPAYVQFAARDLDWARVTFALVDERFVPPSDAASNEALLRRALGPALAQGATLLPMWSDASNTEAAATRADAAYSALSIDVALMGMGGDAHTASWFPDADKLAEALDPNNPQSVMALHAPSAAGASARLSLTFSALRRAQAVLLLITGADKFARFMAALNEPAHAAPVAALQQHPNFEAIWAP